MIRLEGKGFKSLNIIDRFMQKNYKFIKRKNKYY